ncbi:MAG: hypothetical protein IJZ38_03155 [Bacteroides sp.]|nr:hypothetical protein [Bacteroides sp.]
MVRKIMRVACVLALLMAVPCRASAATVYDGNISSTYTTIFRDLVTRVAATEDYVFFRSSEYDYTMVAGDLEYADGTFSGEELRAYVVTVYSNIGSGYSNTCSFSMEDMLSFELTPGSALIYSNLGEYPDLRPTEYYGINALGVLIGTLVVMALLREIFRFVYRGRSGDHE